MWVFRVYRLHSLKQFSAENAEDAEFMALYSHTQVGGNHCTRSL